MSDLYFSPEYGKTSFNCPHCNVFSHQFWNSLHTGRNSSLATSYNLSDDDQGVNGFSINNILATSRCNHCTQYSIWIEGKLLYPTSSSVPLPNNDMPEDIRKIYHEPRSINSLSPRASAALLRLAIERLLPQIGATEKSIDKMIGELVSRGLPVEIQKALDILRVIGNEAVHPGTIDFNDEPNVSIALFKLLNVIIEKTITQAKEIDEIYSLLPESKKSGIENRDKYKNPIAAKIK